MLSTGVLDRLLDGARISVQVTLLAVVWGTVVAVVLGVVSLSRNMIVRGVVRVYVEVFRGVSAIILLFWCYYALPQFGLFLEPMQAGVLALGLNLSAYGTEIVRGAVQSVPKGQSEAAIAINLSTMRRIWSIILPQSAIILLPPYGNLLIEVFKASALVSLIGLTDIAREAEIMRQRDVADSVEIFTAALILYFAISLLITGAIRLLERYFSRGLDISRKTSSGGPFKALLASLSNTTRGGS